MFSTFASLLTKEVRDHQKDEFGIVYPIIYPSEVSRAISIYELNNKLIHGLNHLLGTKISITLWNINNFSIFFNC